MKKLKVVVLMGGASAEHEVSVKSGKEVLKNLDKKKYKVFPIKISKNGLGLDKILTINPDIVFLALHGTNYEDGKIQGFLDSLKIKYIGSGVLASAIGMNKNIFKDLMRQNKIPVPKGVVILKTEDMKKIKSFPLFVKPNSQGSSVGSAVVYSKKELLMAVKKALKFDKEVLVEEYIKGTEVTCSIIGNINPKALPVIEIIPKSCNFFDYKSKYTSGGSDEICPAKLSAGLTDKLKNLAIRVYKSVGCKGFGRVDMILKAGKYPFILEINTIPGLTPLSLFPKAAKEAGFSYSKLLDEVIKLGLE